MCPLFMFAHETLTPLLACGAQGPYCGGAAVMCPLFMFAHETLTPLFVCGAQGPYCGGAAVMCLMQPIGERIQRFRAMEVCVYARTIYMYMCVYVYMHVPTHADIFLVKAVCGEMYT
jgi:hypothetical protein